MIELHFLTELYPVRAVREAAAAYAEFASAELQEEGTRTVVRVSALGDADESLVAAELANFALGLAIEARGAS